MSGEHTRKPSLHLGNLSGADLVGSVLDLPLPVQLTETPAASLPQPENAGPAPQKAPENSRILIIENHVDGETCRDIIRYIEEQYQKAPVVDKSYRSAFYTPLLPAMRKRMEALFYTIITRTIEPYFGVRIEWWEQPQLLRYEMGGRYDAHADAEGWDKEKGWFREHDRDISILLYLNDDFTDGLLDFPDFNFKLQPRPGLLAAFPSHHGYRHAAEPTGSGIRYAIATWAAAEGTERVRKKSNSTNHFMRDLRP